MNNIRCYVAGKSGGHIIPALTLAQQSGDSIIFITTNDLLDATILAKAGLPLKHVVLPITKVPTSFFWYPLFIFLFLFSCIKSFFLLWRSQPVSVTSTGGLISAPVVFAAWVLRIPIELWELNAEPGAAVKLLSRFATTTYLCFEDAEQYLPAARCVRARYPLRFSGDYRHSSVSVARQELGLSEQKKTIFLLGGSQGSVIMSRMLIDVLAAYDRNEIQVIHQTRKDYVEEMRTYYRSVSIEAIVFSYRHDIERCYVAADVIVTRAGSGALFEALHFNKPTILIPLEMKSTSHQLYNALEMQRRYPYLFSVVRQEPYAQLCEVVKQTLPFLLYRPH